MLRPVSKEELIGGQWYINVLVAIGGKMYLDTFVVCGRAWKEKIDQRSQWRMKVVGGWSAGGAIFLSDCGVVLDSPYPDNYHRTFRYTAQNMQVLEGLVQRQDLEGYLSMIGIKNVEA